MRYFLVLVAVAMISCSAFGGPVPGRDGTVSLSWDAGLEQDLTSYSVYRSTASAGPWVKVATVAQVASIVVEWDSGTTGTLNYSLSTWPTIKRVVTRVGYVDAGLVCKRSYWYTVTATDTTGNESARSNVAVVMPVDSTPPKATTVTAK